MLLNDDDDDDDEDHEEGETGSSVGGVHGVDVAVHLVSEGETGLGGEVDLGAPLAA